VKAAGFRSAPYGLASTLSLGYLEGADGEWVASYQYPWDQPPALALVPNTGTPETYAGWQFSTTSPPACTVDVSVHNFPLAGASAPASPATPEDQMPAEVYERPRRIGPVNPDDDVALALQVNTSVVKAWVEVRNPDADPLSCTLVLVNDDPGSPLDSVTLDVPAHTTREWPLKDAQLGDVILQSANKRGDYALKTGTR
jgi:hypothetical protein